MKRLSVLFLALILMLSACGEGAKKTVESAGGSPATKKIVTSLFPQYDFAKRIAGDHAEVSLLLSPGIEAHSFEPTPQDIIKVGESDLFIYTGEVMEPWVHQLLESTDTEGLQVLDLSKHVSLIEGDEDHDHEESDEEAHDDHEHEESDEHDHDHGSQDPHFWTDPHNAMIMVDDILAAIVELDGENQADYEAGAATLKEELRGLDESLKALDLDDKELIFAGHNVFGYLGERYGLEFVSPYRGFSPDAEPTAQAITEMIDLQKKNGTKYIYHEELVEPRVAKAISESTGAEMVLLHGLHNVSPEDMSAGKGFVEIMKENIEKIKLGL